MSDLADVITRYHDAVGRRDLEAVMAVMHPQARFTDFLDGGEISGSDAIRAFYQQLFGTLAPDLDVIAITSQPDGRLRADLQVATHDRSGHVWSDTRSYALYALVDGLIHGIELQPGA